MHFSRLLYRFANNCNVFFFFFFFFLLSCFIFVECHDLNSDAYSEEIESIDFVADPLSNSPQMFWHSRYPVYTGLFSPLLRLLATHFPHLSLVDDWFEAEQGVAPRPAAQHGTALTPLTKQDIDTGKFTSLSCIFKNFKLI